MIGADAAGAGSPRSPAVPSRDRRRTTACAASPDRGDRAQRDHQAEPGDREDLAPAPRAPTPPSASAFENVSSRPSSTCPFPRTIGFTTTRPWVSPDVRVLLPVRRGHRTPPRAAARRAHARCRPASPSTCARTPWTSPRARGRAAHRPATAGPGRQLLNVDLARRTLRLPPTLYACRGDAGAAPRAAEAGSPATPSTPYRRPPPSVGKLSLASSQ